MHPSGLWKSSSPVPAAATPAQPSLNVIPFCRALPDSTKINSGWLCRCSGNRVPASKRTSCSVSPFAQPRSFTATPAAPVDGRQGTALESTAEKAGASVTSYLPNSLSGFINVMQLLALSYALRKEAVQLCDIFVAGGRSAARTFAITRLTQLRSARLAKRSLRRRRLRL